MPDMEQKKNSLAQKAAEEILSLITIEKEFAPGDRLPGEIELAARLGVSRTTLREGIRLLSSRHVLEVRRGLGTFVVQRGEHERPLDRGELLRDPVDLRSVYELRLMVEPQTAYYAAQRATDSELSRILFY